MLPLTLVSSVVTLIDGDGPAACAFTILAHLLHHG
jgi:hypothetical protein